MNTHTQTTSGAVELREDAPLKAGAGEGAPRCAGGPRLVLACFAALSAAITLALFTQIYYGDYEVVPHGGVATSAAACSGAGTDALKAGGRALDAAAAAALCLAVLAPHLTSLDASGSLLYWEYRAARMQPPTLAEWGAAGAGPGPGAAGPRPGRGPPAPRLVAALAYLHAAHGALPWPRVLQPAIDLAKNGFPVSESLAAASPGAPRTAPPGAPRTAPALAAYLESLQHNTSAELASAWSASGAVRVRAAARGAAGAWRVHAGGARAARVRGALAAALDPPPRDADDASARVIAALQAAEAAESASSTQSAAVSTQPTAASTQPAAASAQPAAASAQPAASPEAVATGLAVIDSFDTYVALVTGLSVQFGSGQATGEGAGAGEGAAWVRDEPRAPLDLAPAILTDEHICGTRFVMGGESHAALAQAAAALAASGSALGVERARVALLAGGALAREAGREAPAPAALPPAAGALPPAPAPPAAVHVVRQRQDALLSHADSRAGAGALASRF